MKKKFSKKKLNKMIASNFTDLSSEDIKKLIEIEIAKNAEEVDTDYIDLCFKLLAIKDNQIVSINRKSKPVKTLLIAAIVFILLVSVVTASAYVFDFSIPDFIAELIDKDAYVDINLEYANTTAENYQLTDSDLAKELEAHGITPVTFPEELLTDDCVITSIEYPQTDKTVNVVATIFFEYHGYYGRFSTTQFSQEITWTGQSSQKDIISGQIINVNGMDILIFERKNSCSVIYMDNGTEYNIYMEGDIDTVINFIKSIE